MNFDDHCFGDPLLTVTIKLLLAALAGALIGIEREKHGRPAGLRTHLLVALGSCLMMIISESFFLKYGELPGTGVVRLDPSRVAAQIVAGIGFVGAGVVIKEGMTVRGLTTAACLWLAAGIGMGFGMGVFAPTVIATVLALLALIFLKKLEPFIKKDRFLTFTVWIEGDIDIYPELERIFTQCGMRVTDVSCVHDLRNQEKVFTFLLTRHLHRMGRALAAEVVTLPGVSKISFK